jgi:hypothetical protein
MEEFEDIKGVIRICNSKDRQHNGKKKKGQTTIYKTLHRKDRATRTPLENGDELRCSRRVSSSCSTSYTRHITCTVK